MRASALTAFALALLFAVAGCGGDDDGESAPDETTTSTRKTTTTTAAPGDEIDAAASPYCAVWAEIRATGGPPLTGDSDADDEARREYYTDLLPLVEELQAEASDEIADAVELALEATREVAENGDFAPFERPEVVEAQQRLAAYAKESCTEA